MIDSGSSRVVRPKGEEEEDSRCSQIDVNLAGNHSETAPLAPSGEVLLPGEPLLPLGRIIRMADWSYIWLKGEGPCLVRLNKDLENKIQEIVQSSGNTRVIPTVKGDIPYITESEARILRDEISLTATKGKVQANKAKLLEQIENKRKGGASVPFLGYACAEFTRWLEKSESAKAVLEISREMEGIATRDVGILWKNRLSNESFLLQIDDMVSAVSDPEDDLEWIRSIQREKSRSSDLDDEDRTVKFGGEEVRHFFKEEETDYVTFEKERPLVAKLLSKKRKSLKAQEPKEKDALQEMEEHCLTHDPARKDCEVCAATKRRHAQSKKGSSTKFDDECIKGKKLLTFDWVNPSEIASNGARYLAVVGFPEKNCCYAQGFKVKAGSVSIAIHEARCLWGIEDVPFVLHSDNEGVIVGEEMESYLRKGNIQESSDEMEGIKAIPDPNKTTPESGGVTKRGRGRPTTKTDKKVGDSFGIPHHGVPYRSNTNSRAERFVRSAVEGIRALLFQGGIPTKWWHVAARAFSVEIAKKSGIKLKFNSTRSVPFGTLGRAVLPAGISFKDKFETRTSMVAHLGADHKTSGGVVVLFSDATGELKRATVLDRDIRWDLGTYALSRKRSGLGEVTHLFPGFEASTKVEKDQLCCDSCGKWRFATKDTLQKIGDGDFFCKDVKMSCEDAEDPRIWFEIAEEDFNQDQGDFVEDEVVSAKKVKTSLDASTSHKIVQEGTIGCVDLKDKQEMASALLRLGSMKVDDDGITNLRKVAEIEEKETAEGPVKVFQITVPCKEALDQSNPDREGWLGGVDKEVSALFEQNGVLRLIDPKDLKAGDEVLPSMLVLTLKSDGRKKARIVACGNFQKMPSSDAYCGVVSHDGWLQSVILALRMDLAVAQIDVSTAFLQTDSRDDDSSRARTVLRPPKWVPTKKGEEGLLWEVTKSIYGLRSAPSSWKATLVRWLKEEGFRVCEYDENIFVRKDGVSVLIYVDDLMFLGKRSDVQKQIDRLKIKFECTKETFLNDCTQKEPLRFLGHDLWINEDGLHVDQSEYAKALVKRFHMDGCSALKTLRPEDFDRDLMKEGDKLDSAGQSLLRQIVGGLQYLCQGSRPDLSAVTAMVSEGQSGGTVKHLEGAKRIIRYLRGCSERHLVLPLKKLNKNGCVEIRIDFDASFGNSYARSGLCVFLDDALCFWSTKRQRCITLSTAEAELVASTAAGRELIGLRNFLSDMWGEASGYKLSFKLKMRGDNVAANLISSRQASLRKVRHLCLADLYIRAIYQDEEVAFEYVPSGCNSSDALTKVLGEQKIQTLLHSLCLSDSSREEVTVCRAWCTRSPLGEMIPNVNLNRFEEHILCYKVNEGWRRLVLPDLSD